MATRDQNKPLVEAIANIVKNSPHLGPVLLNDVANLQLQDLEKLATLLADRSPSRATAIGGTIVSLSRYIGHFLPGFVAALSVSIAGSAQQFLQGQVAGAEQLADATEQKISTAINTVVGIANMIPTPVASLASYV